MKPEDVCRFSFNRQSNTWIMTTPEGFSVPFEQALVRLHDYRGPQHMYGVLQAVHGIPAEAVSHLPGQLVRRILGSNTHRTPPGSHRLLPGGAIESPPPNGRIT